MAAGGCRRVTASMMKFKPNQTRTYDREGYKKRAACLCFRSEREDEVSPARGAGGREPSPGQSGAAGAGRGSAALCLGAEGTATCGRPRSGGGRRRRRRCGAGAALAHHLGAAGRGPTCAGRWRLLCARRAPGGAPRNGGPMRDGAAGGGYGVRPWGSAGRGARPSPRAGKELKAVPPRGRLPRVLFVIFSSSGGARCGVAAESGGGNGAALYPSQGQRHRPLSANFTDGCVAQCVSVLSGSTLCPGFRSSLSFLMPLSTSVMACVCSPFPLGWEELSPCGACQ